MWKCFEPVIVKVFHNDNLKKGSKVITVEMFQKSHCQSVSQWQPVKGSKVIIVEGFSNSHYQNVSQMTT